MRKTLYFGLTPSSWSKAHPLDELVHFPLIETVFLPVGLPDLDSVDGFIFTSSRAVFYFEELLKKENCHAAWREKRCIAIGPITAEAVKSSRCLVASDSTAEGVVMLLENLHVQGLIRGATFCLPSSRLSRSIIANKIESLGGKCLVLPLYTTRTVNIPLNQLPILDAFDELIFTSPSCVRAFEELYGHKPPKYKSKAIGPITAGCL